jgi:hypothetical protein
VGFEHTISAFEEGMTVHALDCATTVIGIFNDHLRLFRRREESFYKIVLIFGILWRVPVAWTAQSVEQRAIVWTTALKFSAGRKNILFSKASKLALGPIRLSGAPFRWEESYNGRGVNLTTHLQLVPSSRMVELYTLLISFLLGA